MKNIIIALFITLASFTAKAQEQFNWYMGKQWIGLYENYFKRIQSIKSL